jgi:hypothetical protein
MKKFMFGAIALIAFSFAGMANTGGEEKLNNESMNIDFQKVEAVILLKKNDCDAAADHAYNTDIANGFSVNDASNNSSIVYNNCLDYHNANNVPLFEVTP